MQKIPLFIVFSRKALVSLTGKIEICTGKMN